ncbi:type VI secretion system protein TssA [Pseudoroseomonas wenyumeiae]|uniref:Type VI secretion system protein TssA n=1 Tax=Teichococcus wenyumeiae TaxID=2478470 RepID=A0ABX9VDN9_9PROT|nr:type VI secretion system protein TssA [Pseudoroseomonas wenyumeiae]RMI17404.1 type VI secretion system protein TssA [Pseudoroseomonas wenyumeiae]
MSELDTEQLLMPAAEGDPCGEALDYDLQFLALEIAAQGGGTPDMPEPPDWNEVARIGRELALRSQDLRIGVLLARAALNRAGFAGLREGLELLLGYVTQHWDAVHPRPEPDEIEDQTARVNALANLCDTGGLLADIRRVPLARSRLFGTVAFRDWTEAQRNDAGTADLVRAFQDTDPQVLRDAGEHVRSCRLLTITLDNAVRAKVVASEATRLEPLAGLLGQVQDLLDSQRPVLPEAVAAEPAAPPAALPAGGDIRSREDVIGTIDRICRWYAVHEPASPVPLLLERARRLVAKDFMSLLQDLAPEGVAQVRSIAGVAETP